MIIGPKPLPPLYHGFRKAERRLPQHSTKPFADGKKYLWVASHSCCSGFGNVMQDLVLTAHLTYVSGRSFVFDDYLWVRGGPAYADWNGKLIPAHVPLSAIVAGPIVGGSWGKDDPTPLSISKEHFKKICPKPYILHGDWVRQAHGDGASSQKILDTWVSFLNGIDDPCVEVPGDSGNLFHPFSFGSKEEMLPIWATLGQSPVITLYGWSRLAHSGLNNNRALFTSTARIPHRSNEVMLYDEDPYSQLDGLLAVHVRRGDFIDHCENLGHWGADFLAFNQFPEFAHPWVKPEGDEDHKMSIYRQRCVPTIEQIVQAVEEVRLSRAGWGLKYIYIMSNGDPTWLASLKKAILEAYAWDKVATSRDMKLSLEEKYVSHAVDMLIGQRAQAFIGNGFSSVSSNVAMLRMGRHFPGDSTRMW
ncbi:hypothetical protein BDW22DRAFT_1404258 [Trametopsis cervina]|nr:hypothetical protein BDW22DRAFT_1404258 [Trametopsis cervina]